MSTNDSTTTASVSSEQAAAPSLSNVSATSTYSPSNPNNNVTDHQQITHVLNRDKKYLSEHGQKLFNAINVLLDDDEQLELTQALFKYQRDHNVFTLVRSCREIFDTTRKKSLMLFMRPVIPIRDRFHYDEYYKLFFPEEFKNTNARSIFCDLIPKDLLDKSMEKVNQKRSRTEREQKEQQERMLKEKEAAMKDLEKTNNDLNLDLQKMMTLAASAVHETSTNTNKENETMSADAPPSSDFLSESTPVAIEEEAKTAATAVDDAIKSMAELKLTGFRVIDLAPDENESLGFDVCLGPTSTFIMVSYVEPNSLVAKLGMQVGDELVSVNDISFKMMEVEQAIEILSTEAKLKLVVQTSGFMPDPSELASNGGEPYDDPCEWASPFGTAIKPPLDSRDTLKRLIRRFTIHPQAGVKGLGVKIRGGVEYSLGIFVSQVTALSSADEAGLRVSDHIIEVNGHTLAQVSHQDAVDILNTSIKNYVVNGWPIKLTVRYLGKLPALKKATPDDEVDTVVCWREDVAAEDELTPKMYAKKRLATGYSAWSTCNDKKLKLRLLDQKFKKCLVTQSTENLTQLKNAKKINTLRKSKSYEDLKNILII